MEAITLIPNNSEVKPKPASGAVKTPSTQYRGFAANDPRVHRSCSRSSLMTASVELFPGQYFDEETELHYNHFRYYDPSTGRYLRADPLGLFDGPNPYLYAQANPLMYTDPYGLFSASDLPQLPQGFVDFSAGLGDALLLGTGGIIREALGIDGVVDQCSPFYDYGGYTSFAFGGARVAYAGAAKAGSVFASSGAAASAFRSSLKTAFRGGIGRNWRPPNLAGKSDAQLRQSAGKTNFGVNAYGAGVAAAGALGGDGCGCEN